MRTLEYIQALIPDASKGTNMISFPFRADYTSKGQSPDGAKASDVNSGFTITVPTLAVVPIPYLAIDLFE